MEARGVAPETRRVLSCMKVGGSSSSSSSSISYSLAKARRAKWLAVLRQDLSSDAKVRRLRFHPRLRRRRLHLL